MLETILGDNASRFMIAASGRHRSLVLSRASGSCATKPSSPFVPRRKNRQRGLRCSMPPLSTRVGAWCSSAATSVGAPDHDWRGPTDIVIESRIAPEGEVPGSAALSGAAGRKDDRAPMRKPGLSRFLPLSRPNALSRRKLPPTPSATGAPERAAAGRRAPGASGARGPGSARPRTRLAAAAAGLQAFTCASHVRRCQHIEPSHTDFTPVRDRSLPVEPAAREERPVPRRRSSR